MNLQQHHGMPVYLTADERAIEAAAAAAPDPPPLMERAGLAAAELARDVAGGSGKPVLVVAGPGNNGGDAFVVARHLKQWWFDVTVTFGGDEGRLSADTTQALRAWRAAGGTIRPDFPATGDWALIVDGIFGIGLERDISGRYAEWITAINASKAPVLALDTPSGLHSDSGRVMGAAVVAQHTVTFIALKPGLLTLDGPDHCGELHLATLGLDSRSIQPASGFVIGSDVLKTVLAPRRRNTHKGDYGSIGVLGGDHGMVGAALLAGRAALKLGAGRVYLGLIARDGPSVDPVQPELMIRNADELLKMDHLDCLAVGPGLGQTPDAAFYLGIALESPRPVVLDADALNLVSADPGLGHQLRERKGATLMTPHPAEAARLLAATTREVQHDRVGACRTLAARFNAGVVLKGAGSVCALPDGTWHVNTSGNPGMAAAGMGDVLTGFVAALLAQGASARSALLAATFIHGAAADTAVAAGRGPVGLVAGELIDAARKLLNDSVRRAA